MADLFILAWLCVVGAVALTLWPRAVKPRARQRDEFEKDMR